MSDKGVEADNREAIEIARVGFELSRDAVALFDRNDSSVLWHNERFGRARSYFGSALPIDLDLIAHRWEQFRRDGIAFDGVYAIRRESRTHLFMLAVWSVDLPESTAALVLHRDLHSSDWGAHVVECLDRWPQPAFVVTDTGEVVHVNQSARAALGYADRPLPAARLSELAERLHPALADVGPFRIELRTSSGEPCPLLVGRFPRVAALPPDQVLVSGFYADQLDGDTPSHPAVLSRREREVVDLLLAGHRVRSIASELFLSQNTIRNHLRSIFAKLGVRSQAELIDRLRDR